MTTLRFRLPVDPTEPLLIELDTHRGTANGRQITLDAGGRLTIHLADGSTLTADLVRRPMITTPDGERRPATIRLTAGPGTAGPLPLRLSTITERPTP